MNVATADKSLPFSSKVFSLWPGQHPISGLTIQIRVTTIARMDPSQISHETLAGKLLRLPFRLLPRGAVVRILRGPARGKRWLVESSTRGFWLGFWELENQRWFAARLRKGDVVYDVGAHVGLYTLIASDRVGPDGYVYAIEPLPSNVHFLCKHLELNHVTLCTVIEGAVSNASGWARFDPTTLNAAGHLSDRGALHVRTISLDDLYFNGKGMRPPSIIKIDAEGAEIDVLHGANRLLREFSPQIYLSAHSELAEKECTEFLRAVGYAITRMSIDDFWAEKSRQ